MLTTLACMQDFDFDRHISPYHIKSAYIYICTYMYVYKGYFVFIGV